MGMGGISIWQLLIIFGIIILLFGTKKLRNLGSDLGSAVKGFKSSLDEENKKLEQEDGETINGESKVEDTENQKKDS